MCWVENEDVVGAAPTGDAPTTSEWSTILLPTEVRLILEVLRYLFQHNRGGGTYKISSIPLFLSLSEYGFPIEYHFHLYQVLWQHSHTAAGNNLVCLFVSTKRGWDGSCLINFLSPLFQLFRMIQTQVTYWISSLYLTSVVTAAKLPQHLANINLIYRNQQIRMQK